MELQLISQKIHEIRGQKVMLDFDLAKLYGVETRVFNQAVNRNIDRFPEDFMFQLTLEEWNWSQNVTSSEKTSNELDNQSNASSSPNVMSSNQRDSGKAGHRKHRGQKYLPYAFTEQWGVDAGQRPAK